jgi:hypothetical protein
MAGTPDIRAAQNRGHCAHIWEICGAAAPAEYEPPWESVASGLWQGLEAALRQLAAGARPYAENPLYNDYAQLARHAARVYPTLYQLMAEVHALVSVAKKRSAFPGVALEYAPSIV